MQTTLKTTTIKESKYDKHTFLVLGDSPANRLFFAFCIQRNGKIETEDLLIFFHFLLLVFEEEKEERESKEEEERGGGQNESSCQ